MNGLKTIYQTEGMRGVYKGFHISVFSQATATALFFWLYLFTKKAMSYRSRIMSGADTLR